MGLFGKRSEKKEREIYIKFKQYQKICTDEFLEYLRKKGDLEKVSEKDIFQGGYHRACNRMMANYKISLIDLFKIEQHGDKNNW